MITDSLQDRSRELARASVFIGGAETGYFRIGCGRPVLLLAGDAPAGGVLGRTLARAARVIVPDRVPGDTAAATARWIRDFLDGLGLDEAAIVACERFAPAVLPLAFAEPDRIRSIAIVLDDDSLITAPGIEERFVSTEQRILLLGRSAGTGDDRPWMARLTTFLAAPTD